jgi:hypothetical protein
VCRVFTPRASHTDSQAGAGVIGFLTPKNRVSRRSLHPGRVCYIFMSWASMSECDSVAGANAAGKLALTSLLGSLRTTPPMLAPSTPRIGRAGRWADSERQRTGSEQADSERARGHRPSAPESDEGSAVGPAGREIAHHWHTVSGTGPSLGRRALFPSRSRHGARRYSPGGAAPGTNRSFVPGSYISTAKRTCGRGSREGKSAGRRNELEGADSDGKEGRRALQRGRQGQAGDGGGQAGRWRSRRCGTGTRMKQRVRVTADDAPVAHPLLQPVPPALSEAAADCDSRVLRRQLRALQQIIECARCGCRLVCTPSSHYRPP